MADDPIQPQPFADPAVQQADQQRTADRTQMATAQDVYNRHASLIHLPVKERAALAERRAIAALEYMVAGIPPRKAAKRIAREQGVSVSTADRAVSRARSLIAERLAIDRDEHIARSVSFYLDIAADKSVSAKDRIRARERLDTLLGLDAPRLHHIQADTRMIGSETLLSIVRQHFPDIAAEHEAQAPLRLTDGRDAPDEPA